MQGEVVDKKIRILFDNYRENHYAREAQKEVEQIRTSANKWGMGISTGAFVANELARVSMRSRKYFLLINLYY